MTLSLNEVAAMARKAARGAGFSWGMADEAAAATRWLCTQGLDGCAALAALLEAVQPVDENVLGPQIRDEVWRGRTDRLCPLHAGVALSDRAALMDGAHVALVLHDVLAPTLIFPFVARVARRIAAPVSVGSDSASFVIDAVTLDPSAPLAPQAVTLRIARSEIAPQPRPAHSRAAPDPAAWDALTRLAHRTYAPATAASRAKGAGGDLPDTD